MVTESKFFNSNPAKDEGVGLGLQGYLSAWGEVCTCDLQCLHFSGYTPHFFGIIADSGTLPFSKVPTKMVCISGFCHSNHASCAESEP